MEVGSTNFVMNSFNNSPLGTNFKFYNYGLSGTEGVCYTLTASRTVTPRCLSMTGPDLHTGPFRSIGAEMLGFGELIPQRPMKASREGETRSQRD